MIKIISEKALQRSKTRKKKVKRREKELINKIKTRTARLVRRDYPVEVGKYYWKPVFWTNSYFLSSVGINTVKIVQEYIKAQ